jgi:hypothetical protein|tara:strand:+ start:1735 stop:2169 length:435 start_codon:yes stop_codon:yes gene_type:complete
MDIVKSFGKFLSFLAGSNRPKRRLKKRNPKLMRLLFELEAIVIKEEGLDAPYGVIAVDATSFYFERFQIQDDQIISKLFTKGRATRKYEVRIMARNILDRSGWLKEFIKIIKDSKNKNISFKNKKAIIEIFEKLDEFPKRKRRK